MEALLISSVFDTSRPQHARNRRHTADIPSFRIRRMPPIPEPECRIHCPEVRPSSLGRSDRFRQRIPESERTESAPQLHRPVPFRKSGCLLSTLVTRISMARLLFSEVTGSCNHLPVKDQKEIQYHDQHICICIAACTVLSEYLRFILRLDLIQ